MIDPSVTDADLSSQGDGNVGPIFDHNQDGEPNSISLDEGFGAPDNDRGSSTFSGARSGGFAISGVISYNDATSFSGETVCSVYGDVIYG